MFLSSSFCSPFISLFADALAHVTILCYYLSVSRPPLLANDTLIALGICTALGYLFGPGAVLSLSTSQGFAAVLLPR